MKTNQAWRIESGGGTARSVLECGDLSPLSPLADLPASEGASSARALAKDGPVLRFDGDKSPAESGDKSPHSKSVAPAHCVVIALILLATICLACAQSYSIEWHTIDGGGGTSTGGVYSVSGTIGQPDAGTMSGGSHSLAGGFWAIITAIQMPGGPLLTIRLTQTNTVVISWPSPSTGFSLQQNSDLNTAIWNASPENITDNGTNKFIIVNPPAGDRFYRLFKP